MVRRERYNFKPKQRGIFHFVGIFVGMEFLSGLLKIANTDTYNYSVIPIIAIELKNRLNFALY